jgi:hypothetical protein
LWWCGQRNDNLEIFELVLKVLSESFKPWPESHLQDSSIGHRLWAIACSKILNKKASNAGEMDTKSVQTGSCNSTLVAEHMQLYVDLERKLDVSVEKQIVDAYRNYPHAQIAINLDD